MTDPILPIENPDLNAFLDKVQGTPIAPADLADALTALSNEGVGLGIDHAEARVAQAAAVHVSGYTVSDLPQACTTIASTAAVMMASEVLKQEIGVMGPPPAVGKAGLWSKMVKSATARLGMWRKALAEILAATLPPPNRPLWDDLHTVTDDETGGESIDWCTPWKAAENATTIIKSLPFYKEIRFNVRSNQITFSVPYNLGLVSDDEGSVITMQLNPHDRSDPLWLQDAIKTAYGANYVPPSPTTLGRAWVSAVTLLWNTITTAQRSGEKPPMRVFDPLLDALVGVVPEWDGTERIPTMWQSVYPRSALDGSPEYLAIVARQTMLGFVTRLAGCRCEYVDHPELMLSKTVDLQTIPYINGEPGTGKSFLWTTLFGFVNQMVNPSINLTSDKDNLIAVHKHAVCCCDEFSDLIYRRRDASSIKAFVTAASDEWRDPYAQSTVERPRRFMLVGTGNQREIVTVDDTFRRYLPVGFVTKGPNGERGMNTEWVVHNRLQLIAEAWYKVKSGVSVVLTSDEESVVTDQVSRVNRALSDDEVEVHEALRLWVNGALPTGCFLEIQRLGPESEFKRADLVKIVRKCGHDISTRRIHEGLRKLGAETVRTRNGNFCAIPNFLYYDLIDTPEPTTIASPITPPPTFAMSAN